ncbi:BnaC01g38840D [Brassica napus]|uniref:BnaC01g38840D protein n=2 Tax=Brassica TaxID=3705 RepID=A0A078GAX2_BRANA|nr:BnaC01g38840D [Brassica napus]
MDSDTGPQGGVLRKSKKGGGADYVENIKKCGVRCTICTCHVLFHCRYAKETWALSRILNSVFLKRCSAFASIDHKLATRLRTSEPFAETRGSGHRMATSCWRCTRIAKEMIVLYQTEKGLLKE